MLQNNMQSPLSAKFYIISYYAIYYAIWILDILNFAYLTSLRGKYVLTSSNIQGSINFFLYSSSFALQIFETTLLGV